MDPEFIDALLAIRPRLTSGEFSVALARAVGHVTHFDIKRVTGIDVDRIKRAEEGLTTKCGNNILRILGLYNIQTPKGVSPQIVEMPLSQRTLVYLLNALDRNPVPHRADYSGFNKAYDIAYRKAGRSHREALYLIRDSIDMNLEAFKRAKYPGTYLPRIVDTYLGSRPAMPDAIYERSVAKRLRYRYNPSNNQWEESP